MTTVLPSSPTKKENIRRKKWYIHGFFLNPLLDKRRGQPGCSDDGGAHYRQVSRFGAVGSFPFSAFCKLLIA